MSAPLLNGKTMPLGMDCGPPPPTHSSPFNSSLNSQLPEDHLLNMSPRPSNHLIPALQFAKLFHDRSSFPWEAEKDPCCDSFTSILSRGDQTKSSMELMKEIATLEVQILQMEHYLLSLYRTAFQQHLPTLLGNPDAHHTDKMDPHLQRIYNQPSCKMDLRMSQCDVGHCDPDFPKSAVADLDDQIQAAPKSSSGKNAYKNLQEKKQDDSCHRSLADHLGASGMDDILHCPDRLSEEIVRCISSIYCKLSDHALPRKGLSVSSTSSLSSSSTFSPRDISSSWSPQFNEEAKGHSDFEGLKKETSAYAETIEVSNLYLDDDSFKYAATMLQRFRSLVKSLEKVDPRKMKREEKLAFWLNIHNSLVMHAYLAYGTHNFVRSRSLLKAAYNVGGYCINAYVIQSSILGIRLHYSAPWLQKLLSPRRRFMTGIAEHPFAVGYPEPLVHFALSSGSYCDPMVRIYTAMNVFQELKVAKDEFIRANVYIHKEKKICLPKIVSYFARDMSLSMIEALETVCNCLPELQHRAITARTKNRPDKQICWVPRSSSFRYLIHKEVAQDIDV